MGNRRRAMMFAGLLALYPSTLLGPVGPRDTEMVLAADVHRAYTAYMPIVAQRFIDVLNSPMLHTHDKNSVLIAIQQRDGPTTAYGKYHEEFKPSRKDIDMRFTTTLDGYAFTATVASENDPPFFAQAENTLDIEVRNGEYHYREQYHLDELLEGASLRPHEQQLREFAMQVLHLSSRLHER
jgi:hypothetical protein